MKPYGIKLTLPPPPLTEMVEGQNVCQVVAVEHPNIFSSKYLLIHKIDSPSPPFFEAQSLEQLSSRAIAVQALKYFKPG